MKYVQIVCTKSCFINFLLENLNNTTFRNIEINYFVFYIKKLKIIPPYLFSFTILIFCNPLTALDLLLFSQSFVIQNKCLLKLFVIWLVVVECVNFVSEIPITKKKKHI